MDELTRRERALRCFNFEPADRLCMDGQFHPEVWTILEAHFGAKDRTAIADRLGLGFMKEVARRYDPRWLERADETDGVPAVVHTDGSYESEWGVRKAWGKDGRYEQYVYSPLGDAANIKTYRPPPIENPALWEGVREEVAAAKTTDLVVGAIPTFYRWGWELRGMDEFLCDVALETDELVAILDLLEEHHLELARMYGNLGYDVVCIWGDLAMQTTTLFDPRLWRKHFKPRMARVIETARNQGVSHIFLHSDGNNMPLMDDLVEIGLDAIDPVQPECMDPTEVRDRYPDLLLHGTISSQRTLPFGTVDDVRREVLDRIETCGRRNGLTIAPNNVVQFDVPLENLLCVYETVKDVGPDFYRG